MINDTADQGFDIRIENLVSIDTFWMEEFVSDPSNLERFGRGQYINKANGGYYSAWLKSGYVVITSMDTTHRSENRHVAGIFDFYVRDEADSTRTLHVSDGRFDVRLPQ